MLGQNTNFHTNKIKLTIKIHKTLAYELNIGTILTEISKGKYKCCKYLRITIK